MRTIHRFAVSAISLVVAIIPPALGQHAAAQSAPSASEADPAAEVRLLGGVRQLTFEGRRAGEGYFSADGRQLVFQSERDADNPFFQIFLMDLETGDVQRISPGRGKTTCAWVHPGGRKVLYASTHDDPAALDKQKQELEARAAGTQQRYSWDYDPWYDIYEHDLASGQERNLTRAKGYDAEGSWSPDGAQICFASNRHAYSEKLSDADAKKLELDPSYFVELYMMDADGSNVRRLTDAPGYDGGPFFSSDGRKICWRRFSEDGAQAEVFTMNADGSGARQITHMGAMSWAPYFHPSGDYLIFTTNRHGFDNFELYLVDAEGKHNPVRATHTPGFDGLPAFSPDGKRLAWTSSRGGGKQGQLFIADWNDAEARRLLGLGVQGPAAAGDETRAGAPAPAEAPTTPEITAADARQHVAYLCREELEGRLTGSEGEKLATQYVADRFRKLGLLPAGDDGTYFQAFEFTSGVAVGEKNQLALRDVDAGTTADFKINEDWRPLAFSQTGDVAESDVAFAGYGIVAPAGENQPEYDSFVHMNIKDKWVLVLRFVPEGVTPERRQHLNRFSTLRYKAMVLRDKGARGMIVASGPTSGVKEQLVKLSFDAALAGTSLPSISVTDETAEKLLARSGKSLKDLAAELDKGELVMGFDVPGVKLAATIDIQKVKRTGRNALARLPARNAAPDTPVLVIGAHVDHLGRGEGTNSLARDDEKGAIHYGADDNASGVAGLLEIAENLADMAAQEKLALRRDVIFAAWSGEELGLLGSQHFVDQVGSRIGNVTNISAAVAAYLNMDMIGRQNGKVILNGVGSSSIWKSEIEKRNAPIGLAFSAQDDSYLPTDSTAFYLKGVPVLSAFTGSHAEYHTPRDTPEKLDYEGLTKIARFIGLVARSLATQDAAPDYVAMAKPENMGQRAGLRAYLGTIPDYGESDVKGLKLSGVSVGGPAEQGGLRGGDLIVELAGKKIENIYDYTYAIEALKIGQPVTVVVIRDGQRVELSVTPGSRE
ncbi:MAG: M28 family peptidase [Phycisphaerae bacterium]|jgi:Tol biopolymer transport system component